MQLNRALRLKVSNLSVSTRALPTFGLMVTADAIALWVATHASVLISTWLDSGLQVTVQDKFLALLGLFVLTYAGVGLYPGVAVSPVDELRRICVSTTLIYLVLGAALLVRREDNGYSLGLFIGAWILSILLVLSGRGIVRFLFAGRRWWGYPVMVLGAGKTGAMVIRTLKSRPRIGLKPVLVLDDDPQKHGTLNGVPVLGGVHLAPFLGRSRHIPYAIVAMPGVPRNQLLSLLERYGHGFAHLLIIPDLFGFSSLWVDAKDMGGILGLEVKQQLLLPGPRLAKFLIDRIITLMGGMVLLPVVLLIALLVRLDSSGPVFYGQIRIGQDGQPFKAWKFRSMVIHADKILEEYLDCNPELRESWERDQKLRNDPRITRVGRFLRQTSLDELPQLWNILRGEMSLVGPRPIVDEEIQRYGEKFSLYTKVAPGLTGLWQVSGRNDLPYEERVNLDAYYVRNWSVWLDLYILIRSIWVVISGEGAY